MNNGTIDLQRNGFIATLVINRPAKLNALTPRCSNNCWRIATRWKLIRRSA